MGQLRDEPYRIGKDDGLSRRRVQPPHGRVQRREKLVDGFHLGLGQGVEQGRFPGIRIADKGNHRTRYALTGLSVQLTSAFDVFQFPLEPGDTGGDETAVGFDLGFAGTAHETGAAALAFQVSPASDQPASLVVQRRQFDLQAALPSSGAFAEDFQNQPGAVDDLTLPGLFQVSLLHRGQRRIDDSNGDGVRGIRCFVANNLAQAFNGAGAEQRCRATHS